MEQLLYSVNCTTFYNTYVFGVFLHPFVTDVLLITTMNKQLSNLETISFSISQQTYKVSRKQKILFPINPVFVHVCVHSTYLSDRPIESGIQICRTHVMLQCKLSSTVLTKIKPVNQKVSVQVKQQFHKATQRSFHLKNQKITQLRSYFPNIL